MVNFLPLQVLVESGKTTLLRILAGLEKTTGTINIDNNFWLNDKFCLPSQKER